MIYRDAESVALARVDRLRIEVATLRTRGQEPCAVELRGRLRKNRRAIARARRSLVRLQHPVLRLLPRSMVELLCSAGIAYAAILAAGLGTLIVCSLLLPLLG